jgi:hypothetical protein
LHNAADVIYDPYGYDVLSKLDPLRYNTNSKLKKEAVKAYEEWKSLEHLSRSTSIDRGHFDFADLE